VRRKSGAGRRAGGRPLIPKRLWVAHPCGFVSCKGGVFLLSFFQFLFSIFRQYRSFPAEVFQGAEASLQRTQRSEHRDDGEQQRQRGEDGDKPRYGDDACVRKRKSPEQNRGVVSYTLIVPDL